MFDLLAGWMPIAIITHIYVYPIFAGIMALAAGLTGSWGKHYPVMTPSLMIFISSITR